MPLFARNPEKLETKALDYERRGKTAKALKCREKAARLRGSSGVAPLTATTTTTTTSNTGMFSTYRTPQRYEQNALKWEQRGNWNKAQKNREKVWRMNNPQYNSSSVVAPSFYNNNQFLGYNVPLTGAPMVGTTSTAYTTTSSATPGAAGHGLFGRKNPEKLELKALDYERRGKTAKAAKCREKAARLRGVTPSLVSTPATKGGFTSFRTPQRYEQNALKWEQRNNYTKAQKNREKIWRMNNPQYGPNIAAPSFYNNNKFIGYNVPVAGAPLVAGAGVIQHVAAPIVETHVRPTITEQTMRPEKIVEVQPIVHREVVAPQVHVVEKHLYEQVPSTGPSVITKTAIVEETVKPRIIEEIQPVVHREVPAPFVERVEQHVTEHITKPTTMTKEVVNDPTVRTAPGLAAGGPVVQQTTTTTTTTQGVAGAPHAGGPLAGVQNAVNNAVHRH